MIEKKLSNATPLDDENVVLRRSDKKELANVSLSNLTPTGEKHFLNKTQITNCLLEVPQRIKLTFDFDQGLVLHAGSEVIVPYGKGTPTMQIGDALNGGVISDIQVVGDDNKIFYYITYNSDIVVGKTIGTGDSTYWLYVTPEGTIAGDIVDDIYSQAAQPTGISESVIWYDTTNNYVKVTSNTGSSWTQGNSLLIGRLNRTGTGTITGIRDIYNGVGVIGSNFWVDKDVVYCTPAGRNPDGSLKNNIGKTNHLYIGPSGAGGRQRYLFFNPYGDENPNPFFIYDYISYNWGPILPSDLRIEQGVATYGIFYNQAENLLYVSTSDSKKWTVIPKGIVYLGIFSHNNNRGSATDGYTVTAGNFYTANNPFYLLKYADRQMISNWAFPSIGGGYIDLGLGSSGRTYIAPTDGYVILSKTATAAGQYVQIGAGIISRMYAPGNGSDVIACLPVGRHETFNVIYTSAGTTKYFRFFVTNSYDA